LRDSEIRSEGTLKAAEEAQAQRAAALAAALGEAVRERDKFSAEPVDQERQLNTLKSRCMNPLRSRMLLSKAARQRDEKSGAEVPGGRLEKAKGISASRSG